MTQVEQSSKGEEHYGLKLTAVLPKGDANGLRTWAQLLVSDPKQRRYAVVMFDTARVIGDLDNDRDTAVVRLLRVEVAGEGLRDNAAQLMLAAAQARGADPSLFDDDKISDDDRPWPGDDA